ncbi:MAG: hypothetical protein PF450_15850 [Bacteroidales bacterium]|nr:hypothetical protein [Bacteroidales bacterium]
MRKLFLLLLVLIIPFLAKAQSESTLPWQNSEVYSINALHSHTLLIPFMEVPEMDASNEGSSFYKSLNGLWEFKFLTNPLDAPPTFDNSDSRGTSGFIVRSFLSGSLSRWHH